MNENDKERDGQPVRALDELYIRRRPSSDLEQRILNDFRASKGRSKRSHAPARGAILRAAAALVIFTAGWWVGSERADLRSTPDDAATAPADAAGARFMLLLWEGERFASPLDAEATAAAYAAWAGSVAASGVAISGEELGAERETIGSASSRPSAEDTRVGGYFVIGAADIEAARGLAEGHPHLANGGAIEIVEIVER